MDQNPLSRVPVNIEDEMKRSYMDYAMSVIIGRALPDVRDGLKPANRRVLYAMRYMGLASNRAHRKCAAIVGEVLGKFALAASVMGQRQQLDHDLAGLLVGKLVYEGIEGSAVFLPGEELVAVDEIK